MTFWKYSIETSPQIHIDLMQHLPSINTASPLSQREITD